MQPTDPHSGTCGELWFFSDKIAFKLSIVRIPDDLKSMFRADKEAVYFKSIDDLVNKCKYLLSNQSKISKIGNAGYLRLLNDGHSVEHRVEKIIKTYHKIKNN